MMSRKRNMNADRLTILPQELLGRILSMLPTKDVAATQMLCRRMRWSLSWTTSIDLVYSPALQCPILDERFTFFKTFVFNVLHDLHPSNQSCTRFRLRLGGGKNKTFETLEHYCNNACFPNMELALLHAWISYPLAHRGLRELDLSLLVRNPNGCKLPPGLFACQSLEVLKLDFNFEIDDSADIHLPNLKLLCLQSFVFTEDNFVTRLVSGCHALEDLSITHCSWKKSDSLTVSSHSLQSLVLNNFKWDEEKNSNIVAIDAPNLQYFNYFDNLSYCYSLSMEALVEARIYIRHLLKFDSVETSYLCQLNLLSSLSHVQHLSLAGMSSEVLLLGGELNYEQLPVFRYLRTLELCRWGSPSLRWDTLLLFILPCSPLLEALVFPEGLFYSICLIDLHELDAETAALEAECLRSAETITTCCSTPLKRIEFGRCFGTDRELNVIRFLLGAASVLKDMVISVTQDQFCAPDLEELDRTLKALPTASNSCCIRVER